MRIVNVRMQHACNSSSTHTLLIGRSERTRKYEPGSFGWSHFVLGDRAAKGDYFAAILRSALGRCVGEDAATEITMALAPDALLSGNGIDHQSMPTMPVDWRAGKGLDMEFVRALEAFLLREDVTILGGNDNEPWRHRVAKRDEVTRLPFRDGAGPVRTRRDGASCWTLYSPECGTRVTLDFGAETSAGFERPWDSLTIDAPWLVDVKVTDHCTYGCAFCYQGSTPEGQHATMRDVGDLARALGEMKCFEVAIGGGEPTQHPNFLDLLERFRFYGVTPNFTTRNVPYLKKHAHELSEMVGAVAVSIDSEAECRALARAAEGLRKVGLRVHAQVIDGIGADVAAMRERLRDKGVKTTLLGYKRTGRGSLVKPPHTGAWRRDSAVMEWASGSKRAPLWFPYAVDTAFLEQYRDEPMLKDVSPVTRDIVEGRTSCYVDLVAGAMARSSYSGDGCVAPIRAGGRLDTESVTAAWNAIRVAS